MFIAVVTVLAVFTMVSEGHTQGCQLNAPYVSDEHTLLLLHFDGSYAGADGELPVQASGTTFVPGVFESGVLIDNVDSLFYEKVCNLLPESGSIEFWLKPNWNGNDGLHHQFINDGVFSP